VCAQACGVKRTLPYKSQRAPLPIHHELRKWPAAAGRRHEWLVTLYCLRERRLFLQILVMKMKKSRWRPSRKIQQLSNLLLKNRSEVQTFQRLVIARRAAQSARKFYYFASKDQRAGSYSITPNCRSMPRRSRTPQRVTNRHSWNVLKVTANGTYMRFYINNTLVADGNFYAYGDGYEGLTFLHDTGPLRCGLCQPEPGCPSFRRGHQRGRRVTSRRGGCGALRSDGAIGRRLTRGR